jgi:uncharacterized protein (DUF305 family)
MKIGVTALVASGLFLTSCSPENTANEPDMEIVRGGATDKSAAEIAYEQANARMHEGMGVIDPDPDIAFMQGMIPHHQGAVDMAEIVLEYGKDPETRALAETIIASQTKEIAQMREWLEKHDAVPVKKIPAGSDSQDHTNH